MKNFNKKISIAIGTATLAVGMMALPVLANTPQNTGYSNGTSMMNNQGSMQGTSMTGNQSSIQGTSMTGNQGSMQGTSMTGNQSSMQGTSMTGNQGSIQGTSIMSAFMQKLNGISGAFRQFFGM